MVYVNVSELKRLQSVVWSPMRSNNDKLFFVSFKSVVKMLITMHISSIL